MKTPSPALSQGRGRKAIKNGAETAPFIGLERSLQRRAVRIHANPAARVAREARVVLLAAIHVAHVVAEDVAGVSADPAAAREIEVGLLVALVLAADLV